MKQTISFKLEPSPEQHKALLDTMEAFNRGCQMVADIAYQKRLANKIVLQTMTYSDLRERFGLSSQLAIRAIAKTVEAYKRDKRVHVSFDLHGAMVYDNRIMSFKGITHVSLWTVTGRVFVPIRFGAYQEARIDRIKGQADLVLREGVFYLFCTIDLPPPPPADISNGVLGVDLGIVEIASDSEGNQYSGEQVNAVRKRVGEHRRNLQKANTNSAKKRLRRIARRQSRFVKDTNHCISKKIVATALSSKKAISLEDLTGIRERASVLGKRMRWLLGSWSFFQLAQYITYKAESVGIPVVKIDPRHTSRTCCVCGHCAKSNRKSQAKFVCQECGHSANADLNAAINIAARGALSATLLSSDSDQTKVRTFAKRV